MTEFDDAQMDLADLAEGMPSFVLGDVPDRVLDLSRAAAGGLLPRPRAGHEVVIPEPCQQFVDGLDTYGQDA